MAELPRRDLDRFSHLRRQLLDDPDHVRELLTALVAHWPEVRSWLKEDGEP